MVFAVLGHFQRADGTDPSGAKFAWKLLKNGAWLHVGNFIFKPGRSLNSRFHKKSAQKLSCPRR